MKTNKIKSHSCPLVYLAMLTGLFLLTSCGFVNKVFTKNKEHTASTILKIADSSGLKKQEQHSFQQKDSTVQKNQGEQQQGDLEIVFADSSHHNQVEIAVDGHGKKTVRATGNIKSVKAKQLHSSQLIASSSLNIQESISQKQVDSATTKKQSNTATSSNNTAIGSYKKSWRLPWFGYASLFLMIVLLLYLRYRRTIHSFFQ